MTARDAVVGVYTVPAGGAPATTVRRPLVREADGCAEARDLRGVPSLRPARLSNPWRARVIQALGDRFDFMVWYSDFRVDDQEAGTRSVGDIGQKVSGLGPRMDIGYAPAGLLQPGPPAGDVVSSRCGSAPCRRRSSIPTAGTPDTTWPWRRSATSSAHRWSTRTRAIVNGETIELRGPHDPGGLSGATHWPQSVSTPVPFPYSRPVEASIMGGTNWKDNGDGTFTQLANGTMNPASGFSYLELYLMGFLPASKVPDFFILRNQQNVGRTPEGQTHREGREGDRSRSRTSSRTTARACRRSRIHRRRYNTAIVAVTLHGRQPSARDARAARGHRARRGWATGPRSPAACRRCPRARAGIEGENKLSVCVGGGWCEQGPPAQSHGPPPPGH